MRDSQYGGLRILVIEDDRGTALAIRRFLSQYFDASVEIADRCSSARSVLAQGDFDIVTLDYHLPDCDGTEMLEELTSEEDHPPVIVFTGHGSEEIASTCSILGASGYVIKGKTLTHMLRGAVEKAVAEVRLKNAEAELRRGEAFTRSVLTAMRDLLFVVDLEGNLIQWNPRVEEVLGYGPGELKGRSIMKDREGEDYRAASRGLTVTKNEGYEQGYEIDLIAKDGRRIPFEFSSAMVRGPDGEPVAVCGLGRDITDRKKADAEIRRLAGRVIEEQEESRKRIAADLHDTIGQLMQALKVRIDLLRKDPGGGADKGCQAELLGEMVEEAISNVRRLTAELRPEILDDFGLEKALRHYVSEYSEASGIHVNLELDDVPESIDGVSELNVFRIVQESLNNVRKHAGCEQCRVAISTAGDYLVVTVEDYGKGFDRAETALDLDDSCDMRFGLTGMRERAASVGGRLEIESEPGAGTTVILQVPLEVRR